MITSRRCRLPGQTFQPTQLIWASALEVLSLVKCCIRRHGVGVIVHEGFVVCVEEKMIVAPFPGHLTQNSQAHLRCFYQSCCPVRVSYQLRPGLRLSRTSGHFAWSCDFFATKGCGAYALVELMLVQDEHRRSSSSTQLSL